MGPTSPQPLTPSIRPAPSIWGMSPFEVHDRFWKSIGVEVVRPGQPPLSTSKVNRYLLLDKETLALFPINRVSVSRSGASRVHLYAPNEHECEEIVLSDAGNRFVSFERVYRSAVVRGFSAIVTRSRELADRWRASATNHDAAGGSRNQFLSTMKLRRQSLTVGNFFDGSRSAEQIQFLEYLAHVWQRPDLAFPEAREIKPRVWTMDGERISADAQFFGPTWIGSNRLLDSKARILGPAILWDDASVAPPRQTISKTTSSLQDGRSRMDALHWPSTPTGSSASQAVKRAFDIVFAVIALAFTLPFYPFIMLAILIEDGRPVFFSQRRETLGGRKFKCWKFRSMCRGAEHMRSDVSHDDIADGPQLFVPRDPRLTRIGLVLRGLQMDEWPQFFNVLWGDMSVVGPRPLAFDENQWCPAWREARLSVRAGVTGLWQVLRTRSNGLDFQEWIKYDIQYVEHQSLSLDLRIIWESILLVLRGPMHRDLIRVRGSKGRKKQAPIKQAEPSAWGSNVELSEASSDLAPNQASRTFDVP